MSVLVLRVATALYAIAAGFYLAQFARPVFRRAQVAGAALVGAGFAIHAAAIGLACREFHGAEFFTMRGGFVLLAWLMAGGLLLVEGWRRIPAVGAFATPLILLVLLPALFGAPGRIGGVPTVVQIGLLRLVHIPSAFLGLAFFALASGVALMYLLQEREVKGKHFGPFFTRLPALAALDRLNQRLVRLGFVIFTLAVVTGAAVAKVAWGSFWLWDPHQVVVLLVWILYGTLVQLHHTGWHGRRYALLTMVGFVLMIGSFVFFGALPGLTRHGRDFQ
jgi:ABC-type transport system involved in cytochrome c biogenesis permease subunit